MKYWAAIPAIGSLLAGTSLTTQAEVDVYGFVAARAGTVESTSSWLEGGFGRFDVGANGADDRDNFFNAEAQVAIDWHLNDDLLVHIQAAAYADDTNGDTDDIGLIEAYLRYQWLDTGQDSLAITLGQKFFPTTLENIDDLWQSPYTLTYSAWNSWIAHEFRPIGVELSYSHFLESGARIGIRAGVFGGNDSSGAELAWGGWRLSQRLSLLGETIPLPDLITLRDGGSFADQRDDGSKPFGPDLDDDLGYSVQLNFAQENWKLRATYVDNNGDEALHRGEYAWRTRFALGGIEWTPTENLTFITEFAEGDTRMGPPGGGVDVDFSTAYFLASYARENHRISARYEQFDVDDRDGLVTNNSEDGESITVAYFYSPGDWRFGAEFSDVDVDRPAAFQSGFSANNDGQKFTLEARYVF